MQTEAVTGTGRAPGLLDSLKDLGRTVVDILHTRVDLLVTEIAEEQARLAELVLIAALSLLCFFLSVVFVAFLVVVAFWDTPYRILATGVIAVALFAVGCVLGMIFIKKAKTKPRLFSESLDELGADLERLR
ncbi:MAG: hypothetical protein A3I01_16290 [Betaproteobacteria bacterium RIFCSPLOWO2_02_FULL_65_24]|nr:MAG: hypothetical protein A3I01_16290 [Betaproteobacteria bacterium RIFCSPLOWO2_02_FULL_65_24]OGA33367.1 MAG: hypothetical protein A3G80_04870 [Betaproteobacteria bacterium RIFCSPLOWO2_12_FULL_62_13b]